MKKNGAQRTWQSAWCRGRKPFCEVIDSGWGSWRRSWGGLSKLAKKLELLIIRIQHPPCFEPRRSTVVSSLYSKLCTTSLWKHEILPRASVSAAWKARKQWNGRRRWISVLWKPTLILHPSPQSCVPPTPSHPPLTASKTEYNCAVNVPGNWCAVL